MGLNVALIHHYSMTYNRGGERMLSSIAGELSKRRHHVEVYSLPLRRSGEQSPTPKNASYFARERVTSTVNCDVAYVVYAPLVWRLFRTAAPRVAGVHSFVVWPSFCHEKTGFATLLRHHGPMACGALYFHRVTRGMDLSSFNAIHVPTTTVPEPIRPKVYVIPNWVDLEVFKPTGKKPEIFTISFVGSSLWQKGYDIYLKIAERLRKAIPKARFFAVGVEHRSDLVDSIPSLNTDNLIAKAYSQSHVVVHPSRADIFGLTLIESLACGTPVLTSSLPAHQAFLPDEYICGSPDEYMCKILRIYKKWISRSGQYESLSGSARSVASHFDKEKLFPHFEKMLAEVADHQGGH